MIRRPPRSTLFPTRRSSDLTLQPSGFGDLALQFEALKARLAAEGLFETSRKRKLPGYPQTIGVVTSLNGAVMHEDRKSTRLNSSHPSNSYAVFCLKKKNK